MGTRRRLPRRRLVRFWSWIWLAAMWPFTRAFGSLLFQVCWWFEYGVWLPMPTSSILDGKAFYRPAPDWVASHPGLNVLYPIPVFVTANVLGMAIVLLLMMLDVWWHRGGRLNVEG